MSDGKWISVKDRLPVDEPAGGVIVCYLEPRFGFLDEYPGHAYYAKDSDEWLFWLNDVPVHRVTHWQPLCKMPGVNVRLGQHDKINY